MKTYTKLYTKHGYFELANIYQIKQLSVDEATVSQKYIISVNNFNQELMKDIIILYNIITLRKNVLQSSGSDLVFYPNTGEPINVPNNIWTQVRPKKKKSLINTGTLRKNKAIKESIQHWKNMINQLKSLLE